MTKQNISVAHYSYTPEQLTHAHDYYQIVFPEQGQMNMKIASQAGSVTPKRLAFIEPGVEHTFWATGHNQFLVLNLPRVLLEQAYFELGRRAKTPKQVYLPLNERLTALQSVLRAELRAGGLSETLIVDTLGVYASTIILQTSPRKEQSPSATQRRIAHQIQAYLEAHYTDTVSIEMIAAEVGISAAHAQRCYKTYTGYSIVEQIHTLRLKQAQILLRTTELSILDISLAVGFESQSYFTRLFTRKLKMSPSSYRKQYLGSVDIC